MIEASLGITGSRGLTSLNPKREQRKGKREIEPLAKDGQVIELTHFSHKSSSA
jgi:hypothetical protein